MVPPLSSLAVTPSLTPVTVTVRLVLDVSPALPVSVYGTVTVAVSPSGKGLEVGTERDLDLAADHSRGGVAVGDQGIAGAARRHRAGDGDGVEGAGIGIERVVVDEDREHGRRSVFGDAAGIGDRLRQVVGAVDGEGQGGLVLGPAIVLDGVVEGIGNRVGRQERLHRSIRLVHRVGVRTVGVDQQRAIQAVERRVDRPHTGRRGFRARSGRDDSHGVAGIGIGVRDVAWSDRRDDVAARIGAGDSVVEAAGLGCRGGIVIRHRWSVEIDRRCNAGRAGVAAAEQVAAVVGQRDDGDDARQFAGTDRRVGVAQAIDQGAGLRSGQAGAGDRDGGGVAGHGNRIADAKRRGRGAAHGSVDQRHGVAVDAEGFVVTENVANRQDDLGDGLAALDG